MSDRKSLITAETTAESTTESSLYLAIFHVKIWPKVDQKLRFNLQRFKLLTVVVFFRVIALSNWPFKPVCLRSRAEFSYFCFSARLQPTKLAPFQLMAAYFKLSRLLYLIFTKVSEKLFLASLSRQYSQKT
jgi:hypothetical protein